MFYSQDGQDKYLETYVFKGFKNGIFMDIGAHDGKTINNTLYFEKEHGWKGYNIEPIPAVFEKLVEHRPTTININCAVCNKDGEAMFYNNIGYTEMLSGLVDTFDTRHKARLLRENIAMSSSTNTITVPTKRVETICDEYNIKHIHYLSIDVEGAEFEVIKSINFDKVFIDIIEFENNYNDVSIPIVTYLEEKGYSIIHRKQDIFMMHRDSQFASQTAAVDTN